jgi:TRAP-type C4-dicarboxylate transport system substrate-binding protein
MKVYKPLLLACAAVIAVTTGASAKDYRWSQWQPDNESTVVVNRWFVQELAKATKGEITFQIFSGGVLMPPRAHLRGIGDGVAQGGQITGGYTPSDLPLSNALSGFGFIEPDATIIGAAYADWAMHDPAGNKEWTSKNIVPLGGFATPPYPIICNTSQPVRTLADFKGKKIRWPGGAPAKMTQDLGAVPVNIPAPDIYQALQTKQVDCAGILAGYLNIDAKLDEVSKFTTLINAGGSFISPQIALNKDFWKSLTNEQRSIFFQLAARASAKVQILWNVNDEKALKAAQAKGHQVVQPDASLRGAIDKWIADGVGDMAGVARTTYNVKDPEALFASFRSYVKKWQDIVAKMKNKNDEEELTKVFYDNMFANLNPATYGIQ